MVLSDVFFGNIYEIPAKIVTMETRISAQKMPCEKGEIIKLFFDDETRKLNYHFVSIDNLASTEFTHTCAAKLG